MLFDGMRGRYQIGGVDVVVVGFGINGTFVDEQSLAYICGILSPHSVCITTVWCYCPRTTLFLLGA